jgi:hypothetical protein
MTERGTMRDVNHTHPDHETRDFHWFRRGPSVATDGGQREANRGAEETEMRRVSHTPPEGDGADRVGLPHPGTGSRSSRDPRFFTVQCLKKRYVSTM